MYICMHNICPKLQRRVAFHTRDNITFTITDIPSNINTHNTELQMVKVHNNNTIINYKAVMRPALEYASSIWSPLASSTSINKLQVMQDSALRTATGYPQDTNIQNLHDEALILPLLEHLQFHASQYKQNPQHLSHPLHKRTTYFNTPTLKTIFNNGRYTTNIPTDPPHNHHNIHKNKHVPYT